jgi:two-component system, chemotaxis family, response regulator Rcp1
MPTKPATILMIEDNPADSRLTQEILTDLHISNEITVLDSGEKAVSFLLRRAPFVDAPRPDVILLDWNLPDVDGSELLELIRTSSLIAEIPVVILTGSRDQIDALKAYHLRANCYVTKPIDITGIAAILDSCPQLRMTISTLTES